MEADPQAAIIIPARLASSRLEEKLLLDATGRPLVGHTAEAGARAAAASGGRIGPVLVATDSPAIAEAVETDAQTCGYRVQTLCTRKDHHSGTDRIAEAAEALPATIRYILNLQGDEPETPVVFPLTLLDLLEADAHTAMSTLVRPAAAEEMTNPHRVKAVLGGDRRCLYFSRAPVPFDRNGAPPPDQPPGYIHLGLYGYRREVLASYSALPPSRLEARERLEQLRALEAGLCIRAAVVLSAPAGIDTSEDYDAFVARQRNSPSKASLPEA